MMRFVVTTVLAISISNVGQVRAALLEPGDIALLGYGSSTDGSPRTDTVRFLALAAIPADLAIFFTDEEIPFGPFEGRLQYRSTQTLHPGTVVEIRFNSETNTGVATFGTVSESDPGFDLSTSGDGLIAYLGTSSAPTTYLAALNYSTVSLGDFSGTGLAFGLQAIDVSSLTPRRKAEYVGPRHFANADRARTTIHDTSHWVGGDATYAFHLPTGNDVFTFDTHSAYPVAEPCSVLLWVFLGMTRCGLLLWTAWKCPTDRKAT